VKLDSQEVSYLGWILNRLNYKFKDHSTVISKFKRILDKINTNEIVIDDYDLDKILPRYYADYNLQKEENLGFSEEDKKELKSFVKSLIKDVLNKNFPKENIIKEN